MKRVMWSSVSSVMPSPARHHRRELIYINHENTITAKIRWIVAAAKLSTSRYKGRPCGRLASPEHQPRPTTSWEESAAARVPLLRAAPRRATPDPTTRGRTLDAARQPPGDPNANALPPAMSQFNVPVHRRRARDPRSRCGNAPRSSWT